MSADFDDFDDSFHDFDDATEEVMPDERPEYDLMPLQHEMIETEIAYMQIQDGFMALLGRNGRLMIRDIQSSRQQMDLVVKQGHKLFMDHHAHHLFVSALDGEVTYINLSNQKTSKFHLSTGGSERMSLPIGGSRSTSYPVVESVAFDRRMSSPNTTGTVFFGTNTCQIFSATVSNGQANGIKLISQPGDDDQQLPINGLEQELIGDECHGKQVLLATTSTSLYQYIAPLDVELDDFIVAGDGKPNDSDSKLIGKGEPHQGTLSVFRSSPHSSAHSYVWSHAAGIVHGLFNHKVGANANEDELDDMGDEDDEEVMTNRQELPFNKQQVRDSGFDRTPAQTIHSAFHLFLLYDDRFIVLGHPAGMHWRPINGNEMQEHDMDERRRADPFRYRNTRNLRSMIRDVANRKVYVYNYQSIYELDIQGEHLGSWRLFLERALDNHEEKSMRRRCFEAAAKMATNPKHQDAIAFAWGSYLLSIKDYPAATGILARCNKFEEVMYKVMGLGKPVLVHDYVVQRYKHLLKHRKVGTMQSQMACMVVLLTQLKLESVGSTEKNPEKTAKKTESLTKFIRTAVKDEKQMFEDRAFYGVVGRLLTSHGRIEVMLDYAEQMRHVHYTINYHIARKAYDKAAKLLHKYCCNEELREAWYDFAPLIIPHAPTTLVTGMMRCTFKDLNQVTWSYLDPERLIPTFINYKPESRDYSSHEVIQYIDTAIRQFGCDSTVVHNYMVTLLVDCEDTEQLEDFLKESEHYTTEFALRRCLEKHRFQQCVDLYMKLHLYTDAIQIALEGAPDRDGMWEGLEKAKGILKSPPVDMDAMLLKSLWKIVVKKVIEKEDSRKALGIVQETNGALKLEDVIDDISDNTVIQNFKRHICDSLKDYTQGIDDLQEEMRHANAASELIKQDIYALRHRYGYVSPAQKCMLSGRPLLSGSLPFYVFPSCGCAYLEDAAVERLDRLGGIDTFRKDPGIPASYLDGVDSLADLAATECILCGEAAILEITEPFFMPGEDTSWNIY